MSIVDAARRVALSYDQIEQIEHGGTNGFYSPRHKWLATRKYAQMPGIALPELPELPASDEQADAQAAQTGGRTRGSSCPARPRPMSA